MHNDDGGSPVLILGTNRFLKIWYMVKAWHSFERMLGKSVDLADIYTEFFSRVKSEIALLDIFEKKDNISEDMKRWKTDMEDRLVALENSDRYRDRYLAKICQWGQLTVGRPSRYTELTPEQEEINWQVTWQGFDRAQWLAAFGTVEDLKPHIADPARFINRREDTALIFSDQVPVWIKIGNRKIVFSAADKGKHSKQAKQAAGSLNSPQMSQALELINALEDDRAKSGQTQTRGPQKSGDEKYRVTLECRQAVLNWFSTEDPRGVVLPPILVMHGMHCRLSNISDDRTWIADETIVIAGHEIRHKKGQKIPGATFPQMTRLRKERPDLFENLVVMQQPSATVDEVIIGWGMQDLMLRFSQFVCQRDLVSGALSTTSKIAAKIAHCISCWIGPGMTPVCQLTDTDIAFTLKSFLNRSRLKLIRAMKQRAADANEEPHFKVDVFEMLTMVAESHAELSSNATQMIV